ncbi:MAG: hypothetical protein N2035_01390 [Chthoniobacterales bacterium]|nr:hypothetical protein [Chthoniobacterales bacterium]
MSKPTFRLQTVLDYRENLKEQAENALRIALRELELARARRNEAQKLADHFAQQICQNSAPQLAGQRERAHLSYRAQIAIVEERQKEIEQALEVVRKCRERYLKASRDYEILLRLKQKWEKRAAYESQRREESVLHDIISSRFFQTHCLPQFELQQI